MEKEKKTTILDGKYEVVGVVPGEFAFGGTLFNHNTLTEKEAEFLALRGEGFLKKVEPKSK